MKKSNRGFSLIELMIVLILLIIILSIGIVTYPHLVHKFRIRSDRAAAANIAHAVRGWYSDLSSDDKLKDTMTPINGTTKSLEDISGVEKFVNPASYPQSLYNSNNQPVANQKFFAGMTNDGVNARIVITIGTEGIEIGNNPVVNYNGFSNGVIYIED